MGLTASDLSQLRGALTGFLTDTIALYDPTLTTIQWQGLGWLGNDKSLSSKRDATDIVTLTLPQGTPVAPGQVVRHAPSGTLSSSDLYYVAVKALVDIAPSLREMLMTIALPYVLTGQREARNAVTLPYEEPPIDGSGNPVIGATTQTIRAGFSNQYDPLNETVAGEIPLGNRTAIVPLGADVRIGDAFTLDGETFRVQQVNRLFANQQAYALQIIFWQTAGSGLAP